MIAQKDVCIAIDPSLRVWVLNDIGQNMPELFRQIWGYNFTTNFCRVL